MRMIRPFFYGILCLSVLVLVNTANALPHNLRVPGGIATIPLPYDTPQPPVVYYMRQRVAVVPSSTQYSRWMAVVGIPLSARPGPHVITIVSPVSQEFRFMVGQKNYPAQYLTLPNNSKVTPNTIDGGRINREAQLESQILSTWSPGTPFTQAFRLPASGKLSAGFGLQRYYNGIRRSPHDGLDVATTLGAPVMAANNGRVIATGNYFYTGNTVFIDHGQGVITLYGHMQSISVSRGQAILRGKLIGRVGVTGRSTGPHLHWTVFLNHFRVDPRLVL